MQIHIFLHNSNPVYSPLKTFLHFFLLPYSLYQHATKSEHIQQLHTNPLKHYRNITESKNRNINFYLIYYPAKKRIIPQRFRFYRENAVLICICKKKVVPLPAVMWSNKL